MSWDGSVDDHGGWCCLSSAPRGLRYVSPRRNSHHPSPATRPITTAAVRTGRRRRTARKGCVGRTSMPSRFSRRPIVPGCASAPRRATGSPRSRTSTVSPQCRGLRGRDRSSALVGPTQTAPRREDGARPEGSRGPRQFGLPSPECRCPLRQRPTGDQRELRGEGPCRSQGGCQHLLSRDRINYRVRHRLEMKKWRALSVGALRFSMPPAVQPRRTSGPAASFGTTSKMPERRRAKVGTGGG